MKALLYLMLAVGVGILLLPMLNKNEQIHSMTQEVSETFRSTVSNVTGKAPEVAYYYRWQDAEGRWHFGDKAPMGVEAQRLSQTELTNIIQSVDTSDFDKRLEKRPSEAVAQIDLESVPSGLSALFNPEEALNTIEKAKEVKAMMEARNESLEKQFQ